ncbi:MAG: substrate-binding domain-containing protein [Dermatophilaceae bacterium]
MTRRITSVVVGLGAIALIASTAACSSTRETTTTPATSGGAAGGLIGIAMPTKSLERWNKDGAHLEELLKKAGYETTLQYADNKVDQQITQIQNMINQSAQGRLSSRRSTARRLRPVLATAKAKNIKVIAYDRLINGSENVDYYATFDNYKVGQLQGEFIKDGQSSTNMSRKPVNLEPFAGSPDDNNAKFFFSGAWDVLNPLVEVGRHRRPVGQGSGDQRRVDHHRHPGLGLRRPRSAEMENRLNSFYTGGKKVNVVLSPNDSSGSGHRPGPRGRRLQASGDDWPVAHRPGRATRPTSRTSSPASSR